MSGSHVHVYDMLMVGDCPGACAVGGVRENSLCQVLAAVVDGATAVHITEEYLSLGGK